MYVCTHVPACVQAMCDDALLWQIQEFFVPAGYVKVNKDDPYAALPGVD